ncbi:MAG: glycosyl transferase [Pseudoxanthomonas suwonensis]|nr:MAG: glycosyl transferase [Pseudoxanthomonas suwonensis]
MSPSRRHNFAVYLAAAWSGYFVMGIELLGGRLLAPYFGNSIFVWGALIAVFMACLAFGYLLGGQASLRSPSLRKLGLLLLGAALLALPVVFGGDTALDALSLGIRDLRYGALAGATLLFGGTAVVSGMVSPYAVRLLVDNVDGSGRSAGRLYFASTLGSAAGTIFTSFYLVLWFEVNHIVLGMLLVSGLIATALIAMGGRRREMV